MTTRRIAVLLMPVAVLALSAGQPAPRPADAAHADPLLPPDQRAARLVTQMTLAEKAGQLVHNAPAIPRLGIPAYNWWSEGLHGVARAGDATVFPQAIALAATWDPALASRVADVIATEFRAKYRESLHPDGSSDHYRGLTIWSPNINIFRDPRWGRGQETFGEDPYLTARLGVAFVRGLQGPDPAHLKTLATVKHFAVHSGPEANRHREDVHPSAHDLEDTYLPAFRAAITEGHAQGLMCAYNAIDGVPACASPLLAATVRGKWGFAGHVVSDCAAVADFFRNNGHGYTRTPAQAVAAALNAGMDLICGEFGEGKSADAQVIVSAVRDGLVSEATVSRAARRLMEARIRLGMFDDPARSPYGTVPASDNDTPAHAALATQVAREAMVLLKNDGLLPLRHEPRRIAVIGPNADSVDALVGNYNGTPSHPVTVLAGIRQRFSHAVVSYVEGTGLIGAPLKAVPATAWCQDAACARPGLNIAEYRGTALSGTPIRTGTAPDLRFGWGRPVREERQSSIRWTGFIAPDQSGPYRFRLAGDGGYRIFVDGRQIVNAWDAAEPEAIAEGEIQLQAGRRYPVRVEAIQSGARGDQRLMWSSFAEGEDAAIAAARAADLAVFVGGLSSRLEGEEMSVHAPGFAGGDRTSLDLPAPQERLLERLRGTGKPVVLVLMNGSAMSINWADRHLPAIVEAWYPGGPGGRAVADLLAGDYSPGGRLPVTFYASADQLPPFGDYAMAGRTYRYFTGKPLYPFGYGLSYTRFAYSRPVVRAEPLQAGQPTKISVTVRNVGQRAGDEVVQLYVSRAAAGAPIRSLAGLQRVSLKAGEARQVSFSLAPEAFGLVDDQGRRVVEPGSVDLWIGGGQPSVPAGVPGMASRLRITGRAVLAN
jgi:beta-glucosidase